MDRLKNKTILIGKEPDRGRLLISIQINGQTKAAAIGEPGSVPNCVSRCKPAEGVAHCKIVVDNNGSLTITNLKSQNVTFVNGTEIESKKISPEAKVALGRDMYPISINAVMTTATKLVGSVPPPPPEPKPINYLEAVWVKYETTMDKIAEYIQIKAKKRLLPMVIGSASGLIAPLLAAVSGAATLYITAPISIISFIIYLKIYNEKDTSIEDKKAAQDELMDNYICPHCNHFLGQQPYKILRQNKKCPYCGGGWIEK